MAEFLVTISDDDIEQAKDSMWNIGDNPSVITEKEKFNNIEVFKVMLNNMYYGVDIKIVEIHKNKKDNEV